MTLYLIIIAWFIWIVWKYYYDLVLPVVDTQVSGIMQPLLIPPGQIIWSKGQVIGQTDPQKFPSGLTEPVLQLVKAHKILVFHIFLAFFKNYLTLEYMYVAMDSHCRKMLLGMAWNLLGNQLDRKKGIQMVLNE